jgi:predicted O-methyltransferase YrrM
MQRLSQRYVLAKSWETYLRLFVRPPDALSRIPGYLHPLEQCFLYWLAASVPRNGLALEIGSFKGKSSACIAAGLPQGARLACVDTWQNDAMPYDEKSDSMNEFLDNTRSYRQVIEPHRGTSSEVAATWDRPIDFLFIDGDHTYEGCSADIKAWLGFVRRGGWIAFHDSSETGVWKAISELFPRSLRRSERNAWSIFAAIRNG